MFGTWLWWLWLCTLVKAAGATWADFTAAAVRVTQTGALRARGSVPKVLEAQLPTVHKAQPVNHSISVCTLLPFLDLCAEQRSGVLKLIKELLREKLLDHPYDEWLKRNQEKLSFSLASSTNTNVHFVPDICVCSKKSPRKEALAFFHLEVMKKTWELSCFFLSAYCVTS